METIEAPPLGDGRRPPLVMLSYTEEVSEDIRRVCSMLTKVKDIMAMGSCRRWRRWTQRGLLSESDRLKSDLQRVTDADYFSFVLGLADNLDLGFP